MVCLYGLTLCRLETLLTNDELDYYYSWNWLIHKLIYFVYTKFGHGVGHPDIPKYDTLDPYSIWFYRVFEQLADEFHDATPILTLRCLENTPEEKMAEMMYGQLPLGIQLSFLDSLQLQDNPADGDGGDPVGGGLYGGGGESVDMGLPILC